MIIVARRIEGFHKGGTVNNQRLSIVLSQEIVAVIRVWITGSLRIISIPGYGALSMKQSSSVHNTGRHLLQIIGFREITAC